MVICNDCKQEISDPNTEGCTAKYIEISGKTYKRIPYGKEQRFELDEDEMLPDRCGECGVKLKKFHHSGCDIEECPKCHCQLLACRCQSSVPFLE